MADAHGPVSLRMFPFLILLQENRSLLSHRYLLTIVDSNDRVVRLCSSHSATERYVLTLPAQPENKYSPALVSPFLTIIGYYNQ